MNSFQNGTWPFKAQIEPSGKRWEVQYYSTLHSRDAVMKFVDEAAAKQFAHLNNGMVREIKPRQAKMEPAR